MADGTIRVVIDAAGSTRGARRVRTDLDQIRGAANRTGKSITATEGNFTSFTKSMIGPLSVVVGLTAVAKALASTIRVAGNFQKAVSELSAITGATGEDLKFLSDQAKFLGRTTTLSASEVAQGFKLIASAKPDLLESGEALTAVTKEAITLAEAAGISLPEAASALGGALNQFQADADDASRFINVLAAGSQKGASEIPELTQALKAAGTVAAGANLSFEATIANIETLAEVNLKGAEAGTNLRNIILRLQKEGIEAINPKVVGLTTALRNLNAEQRTDVELLELFGTESFAAASALLARTDRTEQLERAITGTLTAEEQALINNDNLQGKTKQLNSAIEGLAITIGTVFLPAVESSTSFLTNYTNQVTDALEETIAFSTGITNAFGDAGDTAASFVRNIADKSIEEIEDRIRQENQVLNDLLDFSVSDIAAFQGQTTFGISTAIREGDIQDLETFIASLKKFRTEKKLAAEEDADAFDTEAALATAKAAAELAQKRAKAAAERKKQLEAEAKTAEQAAKAQETAFARLASQLDPLAQAELDFAASQKVLRNELELTNITEAEHVELQERLKAAFEDARDPLQALNDRLAEEKELSMLTTTQKAIELAVRQEVDDLKKQGVELTEAETKAVRDQLSEIQRLNDLQNASKTAQKEVNEELELQKSILEEIKGPQEDMNDRLMALSSLLARDAISLEEFNEKLADLRKQTLAGQTSVEAGFERGFIKAQENLNDFASLSEKVVTNAFSGMEDGIVNFAKTGKIEMSSLVDTILEDIVRLESRRALSSFFGKAAGAGGDSGSGLFGLASSFFNSQSGGGTGTQSNPIGGNTSGFAGIAGSLAASFASNQDGGIETSPTISKVAEKGPEAIVPLKGGAIPVELKESTKPPTIIQNTFNISTPDPAAFGRSSQQIGNIVGRSMQGAMGRNG